MVIETIPPLQEEMQLLLGDTAKVKKIIAEASENLRRDFKLMDEYIRSNTEVDDDYTQVFRRTVSTLQFEDIAQQLLEHHLDRIVMAQDVLGRIKNLLEAVPDDLATADENQVRELREEIQTSLANLSPKDSVKQTDLSTGEIELF